MVDGGDAALAPGLQQGIEQRPAVLEAAIEPALGDAEALGNYLHSHAVDAGLGKLVEARLDPPCAAVVF